MSRIRFTKTTEPATPPANKSTFYIGTDDHLKRKLDNGTVIDYDLGSSVENIQDAVGAALTDTSTIDMTYDDTLNQIKSDIVPGSITDTQVDKISPTKITDAQNGRFESSLITNNATPTQIISLDCALDQTLMVEVRLTARRIGGLAGSPGDGATFKRSFRVKTISSSVTVHDLQSDYTSRDVPTMNVTVNVSTTNVIVNVIGVLDNNLQWNCDVITSINK
ncbi:MAG TPA: hypothetical protein PKI14_12775 [Fervidobacterium sp.]|nr:hypothetical protein [Fervidobacterium sp.]